MTIEIRGLEYDADDIDKIKAWVSYVTQMLRAGFETEAIAGATGALAEQASLLYPQLESGGPVSLNPRLSGPTLTWPNDILEGFINVTGDVLFAASDGPLVAGGALQRAVTRLGHKRSGRENRGEGNDA